MNRDDLLNLIPAYALDALDNDERQDVEALLADDLEAQAILQEYQFITETLAYHVPVRPAPSQSRANLTKALASRRGITVVDKATSQSDVPKSRFSIQTLLAIGAAVVVVVIGILFALSNDTAPTNPNEELYNQLIAQNSASQFTLIPEHAPDSTGDLVVSADNDTAVLRIASLPDTSDDESYQLWLITDEAVHSGGIFHWATGHGPYYVAIDPTTLDELIAVGMTIEPFEGSPLGNQPTGDRLFAVQVASAD